jgi:hypothetical protein
MSRCECFIIDVCTGDKDKQLNQEIVFCPLHASALDLLFMVKELLLYSNIPREAEDMADLLADLRLTQTRAEKLIHEAETPQFP